jgi:hypothetical protein
LPSTKHAMICARRSMDNLFMSIIMLARVSNVKRLKKKRARTINPCSLY